MQTEQINDRNAPARENIILPSKEYVENLLSRQRERQNSAELDRRAAEAAFQTRYEQGFTTL